MSASSVAWTSGRLPASASVDGHAVQVAVAGAVIALTTLGAMSAGLARAAIGALALSIFTAVAFSGRRVAITAAVTWLVLLGFTRRLLIPFAGWSADDPLLLFSPAAAVILAIALRRDRPPPRTAISSIVAFQLLWLGASLFNPNESDIVVALKGALYFAVPLLWVFVGRRMTSRDHDRLLDVIVWLLVPVVAHGLWQTFVGLLPFELTWLGVARIPAAVIFIDGFHIRPFSTLNSPQEYGLFLVLGAAILWARILRGEPRRGFNVTLLGLTTMALFLQSSRGIFLGLLAALFLQYALHRRSIISVLVAAAAVIFLVSPVGVGPPPPPPDDTVAHSGGTQSRADDEESGGSKAAALFRHEIDGLLHPEESTAPLHAELIQEAVGTGLDHPLGLGPSHFSLAGFRDGEARPEDRQVSPEFQLPITLTSLGMPAAAALLALYATAFLYSYRLWRRTGATRHLVWIAFLVGTQDQTLNGLLYGTSTILALVIGGISTEYAHSRLGTRRADSA